MATLGGIPVELNYGLITLAPLGVAYGGLGIMMAFLGCILAGLLSPVAGSVRGMIPGSRPGIALILAHLLESLMRDPALQGAGAVPTLLLLVLSCCALAGLLQMVFGLLGVGRAIRYLPYPVLSGLMCGIALLMLLSTLKPLLGLDRHGAWGAVALSDIRWLSLVVAGVTLWVSFSPPRALKAVPTPILALVAGTVAYYLLALAGGAEWLGGTLPALSLQWPLAAVLAVDANLPGFSGWLAYLPVLLPFAATIAVLASLESLLCAVSADQMLHGRHDSRRELLAQGCGNLAAALGGGSTMAGTAARLVANVRGGGRTPSASLFYAGAMALVMLWGLPWLGHLPEVVTAVLLVVIALGMVDGWLRRLCRNLLAAGPEQTPAQRRQLQAQGALAALVALCAVVLGLLWAVGVGVIAAMVLFVRNNSRPVIARVLSGAQRQSLRVRPGSDMHWLEEHGAAIALVELEGSLFFGTADRMQRVVEDSSARWVILDFARVTEVDATGVRCLQQLTDRLAQQGRHLLLASVRPESALGRHMASFGLVLREKGWFPDGDSALEHCENALLDERGGALAHDAPVTLGDCSLARGLQEDDVALLAAAMGRHGLSRGQTAFVQGEEGDQLYLVMRGTVSIRIPGRDGHQTRIAAFGPGVCFGEMSLLEGKPRSATAVADEEVELLSLSRASLDQLTATHPAIVACLIRNLSLDLADRLRLTTAALRDARP